MATTTASSTEASKERLSCIFCKIADGVESSNIVHQNEELVVFPDKKPAAPHHYLVVPRKHLPNAKELTGDHHELVVRMVELGRKVAKERAECDDEEVRLGFHWPPFNSIAHLHLHAIAPQSKMGLISRGIFQTNSFYFASADFVLDRLKKMQAKQP